tara:strand:- start:783 stop:911 length:129 start_codon:yes stop_codon:yes gene_type:complete
MNDMMLKFRGFRTNFILRYLMVEAKTSESFRHCNQSLMSSEL